MQAKREGVVEAELGWKGDVWGCSEQRCRQVGSHHQEVLRLKDSKNETCLF